MEKYDLIIVGAGDVYKRQFLPHALAAAIVQILFWGVVILCRPLGQMCIRDRIPAAA